MIDRELTEREKEILGMIRPTTFQDMVDAVRKDVDRSKYDAKRELRNLHNGITKEITVTSEVANRRDRINNIRDETCDMLV